MSDRIVVMCEGRITGELMPEEATPGAHHAARDATQINGGLK